MRADLHLHTVSSDGGFSAIDVCMMAKRRGLDVIALTDHDTYVKHDDILIDGLRIIHACEVSSICNGESIHVLAYFNGEPPKAFRDYLDEVKLKRIIRANKILDLLEEKFDIKLDRSFLNKSNSITRGEISREIIRQGYKYSTGDIFKNMLGNDCPCFIPAVETGVKDIIKLIKDNNGLCVLAHPMLYKKENLDEIIGYGFDGMECKYPNFQSELSKYKALAKKYNMFITAGSDFHTLSEVGNTSKHGNVGDVYIDGRDLDIFLSELEKRG